MGFIVKVRQDILKYWGIIIEINKTFMRFITVPYSLKPFSI